MDDQHPKLRAATDVGGTFTDLVTFATDPVTGRQTIRSAKSDTTPPDFERGVVAVLAKASVRPDEIAFLAHGTTIVINAITERKGVRVGLLTTEGFRDSLEIARGNRPDFFNLFYEKPGPFVPRRLRREVTGRIAHTGEERAPLDLGGLPAILNDFRANGVEAVAVCLLHSYANAAHEQAVLAGIRELWPEVAVVASHQITREWREYERTSTTVLSAYVQPIAERYLHRLAHEMKAGGFGGSLYVMQSNCGIDTVERTRQIPITMVESGPASGFWGAAELGRLLGEPNVLALDIGGTTAKCSLIENGQVKIMTDYWIERDHRSAGYPIMVPVVDLVEIGQGGGSIAWVDDFGKLRVGPQSAGALPGPASYGKGGHDATTTDANLALGRINPTFFRGGEVAADMEAVAQALAAVAEKTGLSRVEAARGIVRIANHNMISALKLVSVNRGHDPREFTLVAFGGGGPMHAAALAGELGIKKVIVPRGAGVFSAWGMLMSDLRRDYFQTRLVSLHRDRADAIDTTFHEVEEHARAQFGEEGVTADRVRFVRFAKLRYENQEHAVEIRVADGTIGPAVVDEIEVSFHESYEREYTYRLDAPVELVGVHVVAHAEVGKLELERLPVTGRAVTDTVKGTRAVDYALEGIHEATIVDGSLLEPGMEFAGPAIVESDDTTIVVHPFDHVSIDEYGNTHITVGRLGGSAA